MDVNAYYQFVMKSLEASAAELTKQQEHTNLLVQKRQEEAQLSSSGTKSKSEKQECDKDCKRSKYSHLSPSVYAKLLEHNIPLDGLNDNTALSKLTKLGVPIEDMAVAITLSGKDLSGIRSQLFKKGKGSLLKALSTGFDNLSMSSVYDHIDKLSSPKELNNQLAISDTQTKPKVLDTEVNLIS